MRPVDPTDPPPTGRIESKIAWAEAHAKTWGAELAGIRGFAGLLQRFKEAVRASRREMADAGVVDLCRQCEEEEGGSCCGAGLEDRYDAWLLLINALLGVALPRSRPKEGSCFFLLDRGCCLEARHTICVNYVCKKACDRIDPRRLRRLRDREGAELGVLFLLHEEVKRAVRGLEGIQR